MQKGTNRYGQRAKIAFQVAASHSYYGAAESGGASGMMSIRLGVMRKGSGQVNTILVSSPAPSSGSAVCDAANALPAESNTETMNFRFLSSRTSVLRIAALMRGSLVISDVRISLTAIVRAASSMRSQTGW